MSNYVKLKDSLCLGKLICLYNNFKVGISYFICLIACFASMQVCMRTLFSIYLLSGAVEDEASSSSNVCWNNSLFSSIKCLCISDIWAIIFSRRRRAISAFRFRSALSLSRKHYTKNSGITNCQILTSYSKSIVLLPIIFLNIWIHKFKKIIPLKI